MTYKLSEYGVQTIFDSFIEAIKYCKVKKLIDGENGRLWLIGKNKKETNAWRELNSKNINYNYMIVAYKHGNKIFIWDEYENKYFESEMYWAIMKTLANNLINICNEIKMDE